MTAVDGGQPAGDWGPFEPLRERAFRRIWSSSLLSNFGHLILGVGAAWEMTRLATSAEMVALVQSALMLPLMLVSVPGGAIADMFDRRRIAMTGLGFASLSAATLAAISHFGLTSPWLLLAFCSLIGAGVALYGPSWQASISEQVPPDHLPAAVALGSISYNIARSIGPALGGMIVLAAGTTVVFAINAVFYLPLLGAFFLWRRPHVPSRLPPESIHRAIVSGVRYVIHAPAIRIVLIRSSIFGAANASIAALTPLVARDLLHGDATTYGLLLGANGIGAVTGALLIGPVRRRLKGEQAVRLCVSVAGVMVLTLGLSRSLLLSAAVMLFAGAANMLLISLLNVAVQLSAPRWVTARALSLFSAALTGGIALGAWLWGQAATEWGVVGALIVSGVVLVLTLLVGFPLPMPAVSLAEVELVEIGREPEVALPITARSGPIVIEFDYRVDPAVAREFYRLMLDLQRVRLRNGGFDWSISRDIADPALWTERYHLPTWGDYLRLRSRFTQADRDLQEKANAFHQPGSGVRVRRRLERPFGSVRSSAETPDPQRDPMRIDTP